MLTLSLEEKLEIRHSGCLFVGAQEAGVGGKHDWRCIYSQAIGVTFLHYLIIMK